MEKRIDTLRKEYSPELPMILRDIRRLILTKGRKREVDGEVMPHFPGTSDLPEVTFGNGDKEHKSLRVGVVLSGGQASGGHNVICGLFDALKTLHPDSTLYGFQDGPAGIIENRCRELTEEVIDQYRNTGGFDLIGSGRTKIETDEQFQAAKKTAQSLKLDGLLVIGGDDSNTNAALLAEYFIQENVKTAVAGVPKTIDGDLKNEDIEISFGFDTATKTFSETIGSILRDSLSAKKYYFFIKMMGRSASHIALECALQTHPNLALIGEEIAANRRTLQDLTDEICDMIEKREEAGKRYGAVLIPEGVIEFIPEFKKLIVELNPLAGKQDDEVVDQLSDESKQCFLSIPDEIRKQLLMDRDPHGNVQVSKIETERLFIAAVQKTLKERGFKGKFSAQPLFLGYEGRSCYPSNFDAQYCYALGYVAALLIDSDATGYISCIKHLTHPVERWQPAGIPLPSMIRMEERKGKQKPVIEKALVNLEGAPYKQLEQFRENWKYEDDYLYPGPIQFFGPKELTDVRTLTLELERELRPTVA